MSPEASNLWPTGADGLDVAFLVLRTNVFGKVD